MKLKEKYDIIIESLSKKSLNCDELIAHLKENRFRNNNKLQISLNDITDDLNSQVIYLRKVLNNSKK